MYELHSELLWFGNAIEIREPAGLFEVGVQAVIDVAFEEKPSLLPRQLIYCRFPIVDGGGNDEEVLRVAVRTTVDLISSGTKTIVACSAGMSRGPMIATFALAAFNSESPKRIIQAIAEKRALEVNGKLWNQLNAIFPYPSEQ